MYLATNDLLVPADATKIHVEPVNTAGWSEVCKGLYGILAGYLLIFGAMISAVVLLVVVITQMAQAHAKGAAGGGIATLIVGAIVVVLLILGGYGVIIRSQWRCLRNASEQCHAKWWMFAAMLCVVAGPVLGTTVSLTGDNSERAKVAAMAHRSGPLTFREALVESRKAGASAAPMQIISSVIGLLSQVFFVLFLRSVALSFNDSFRARFVEMYLLLTALLFAGLVGLILRPEYFLNKPLLLLFLGGGTVLSGVWYFVLIISTCACIHKNLALLRARS
jgi:hypothetical protein